MKDRIKALRKQLKLTQEDFAEMVGLSTNYISMVENGVRNLADRTIADICRIFEVNEEWLKNGIEPMFLPPEDEEASYVAELLGNDANPLYDLIKAIMKTYSELEVKEKQIIESFAKGLSEKMKEK